MASIKIICKPEVEGGICSPMDTKFYIDGVLQEDVRAISFGISCDDILSEIHIVKSVESVEVEIDGLEVVEEGPTQITQIMRFAGIETCETCGHSKMKFDDITNGPAEEA